MRWLFARLADNTNPSSVAARGGTRPRRPTLLGANSEPTLSNRTALFGTRLPIPSVNLRVALVGRFNLGWYKRIPDPHRAREHVLRIRSCLLHRCAGSFGRHAAKGANLGPDQIARRLAMIGADLDHQLPASSTPGGRPRRMLDRE